LPGRPPVLCAGCPHAGIFFVLSNIGRRSKLLDAAGKSEKQGNLIVTGDIGCYSMGLGPAGFFMNRTQHSMGSGAGLATGFGQLWRFGFDQPVIAVAGDSTFFHAVVPALVNGVHNKANFVLVILDNGATAMTGFQPHPGTELTAMWASRRSKSA